MTELTSPQVAAIETALSAFSPNYSDLNTAVRDLSRGCQQYQQALQQQTADNSKIQQLKLKQTNPEAYARVLASLPQRAQEALAAFAALYTGALPAPVTAQLLSKIAA